MSSPTFDGRRMIDLTYTLTPEFPLFPVFAPTEVTDRFCYEEHGFFVCGWSYDEHCGTHVDAPAHFGPGTATVDQIDLADLWLNVAVVDISDRVRSDHDAMVAPDDVLAWEKHHGPLPAHTALFAHTGWGQRVGSSETYFNVDASGMLHTPGFSSELTDWLAAERPEVRAIGIDTASLDAGACTGFLAHRSWLPTGRYGIENLARLADVPPAGATVVVGAPKLGGGSGGPARILVVT